MLHLTRWRVVAATAVTAVAAAGAFGISNALAGPSARPAPIELQVESGPTASDAEALTSVPASPDTPGDRTAGETADGATDDADGETAAETATTTSTASANDPTSIVSPDGPVTTQSSDPAPSTPAPADDSFDSSGSVDSSSSADS